MGPRNIQSSMIRFFFICTFAISLFSLQGCPSDNSNANNEYLYATNQSDNTISGFVINPTSGTLSAIPGSPFSSEGSAPVSIAITPNGKWAYAINQNTNSIASFSINPSSGTLSPLLGYVASSATNLVKANIDSSGAFLYVLNQGSGSSNTNTLYGYAINPENGALAALPGSPFVISAAGLATTLAIDPQDRFIYAAINNSGNSYIDVLGLTSNTGIPTNTGTTYLQGGSNPTSISINAAGTLIFLSNLSGYISVSSINASSGALSPVTGSPFPTTGVEGPAGLAITPSNNFLLVANQNSSNIQSYSIDTSSGFLTSTGLPVSSSSLPSAIAIEPNGNFLFVGNGGNSTISVFSVSSSGLLKQIGSYASGHSPSAIAISKPAQN